jgi:perosamine synthetase
LLLPIHHAFAPHVDGRYLRHSLALLLQPWRWRRGSAVAKLENAVSERLGGETITFGSGRQALLALLQTCVQPGDEVIVQGYTCVVVSNAIHAAGAKAVYADIELETLNISVTSVQELITPRTRAVICQHTFGIPARSDKLRAVCDTHGLLLIEDCAHIFPDRDGPRDIALKGDAVLLSFGRDKAVSGVAGGAIVVRKPELAAQVRGMQQKACDVPVPTVFVYLCYPLVYTIGKLLMTVGLGRHFLWVMRRIRLLIPIVRQEEKDGHQPLVLERMPNACAVLALRQLVMLEDVNAHRRALTAFYADAAKRYGWRVLEAVDPDLPLQKFPIFTANAESIRVALRKHAIHLEDGWQGCVICPAGSDNEAAGYTPGTDPVAEDACVRILSLPTHPTMTRRQAEYLVNVLDQLLHKIA